MIISTCFCGRFEQRHKTLNYFSVMLSKKVQNKEDDETKPSELVNSYKKF